MAVGDVNGDGKPDLVVASGSISVLLGNGDGTFQTAVNYSSGGGTPYSVAIADVNGDGKPDIVVADFGNGVGVLLNNGDGTFQTAVVFGAGSTDPDAVAVGDVNGDGKPDIVVGNFDGYAVAVLLGNGDGTFQTPVTYASGGGTPYSVAVTDVNGDGKPDIIVANSATDTVGVLLGNGDGTFQTAVTYASGGSVPSSVVVSDMNGDGRPDIVVANWCDSIDFCDQTDGTVAILLGNGDGTFQGATSYDSGVNGTDSVAVGDVNGDGKPDVVVVPASSGTNTLAVFLGNGDGTLQPAIPFDSGGSVARAVAVADLNGDGKPDVSVTSCGGTSCANQQVGVLINLTLTPTTSALLSSQNPSKFGQSVTFTASVTALGFKKGTPTGTIDFLDGTASLANVTLNSAGVATFATSTLAIGTHPISAGYGGDKNFAPSTSPVLNQLVQSPKVSLSTTALNFGNQTVGIPSAAQAVTLKNVGNITLTINAINITGTNVGDFSQTNNCGTSVAAGGSCRISVTFTPTTTGTRSADVTITDNGPKSVQTISLSGTGVVPTASLSPTSLAFTTQVVFTTSKPKTATLTNTGLGILNIVNIAVSGPFTQTNTCGSTLNPAASCTFTVTFKPTTIGALTGAISITDNAGNSPQKISLSGTGTYIQLTPAALDFGNQPVGTKSLPKKITLSNKGSVAVSITAVSIAGADAGDFSQTNTCGHSVAAGASCFITVTFTPASKGVRSAAVSVSDNGGGSPQKVNLTGTGT